MAMRSRYEILPSVPTVNEGISEKIVSPIHTKLVPPEQSHLREEDIVESRWDPGFRKRFPWVGFCALVIVFASALSSVVVLYLSNHVPATRWFSGNAPPNVLLSVFNNLGNLAITVAVGQGVAISWWRGALAGNTIRQLHYSWSFSATMSSFFTKFRYFNAIALAALMTKVTVIDGVLYQKATSAYTDAYRDDQRIMVTAFGAPSFPTTGYMGNTREDSGAVTENFGYVATMWDTVIDNRYVGYEIQGCTGVSCKFNLTGPGFAADCTNSTKAINYGLAMQQASSTNRTSSIALQNLTLFSINFTRSWPSTTKNYSAIILEITYPDRTPSENGKAVGNGSCPANLIKTVCELRPAMMNFTIFYTNSSSAPKSQQRSALKKPKDSSSWLKDDWTNPYSVDRSNSGIQLSSSCEMLDNEWNVIDETCMGYDASLRSLKGIEVLRNNDLVEYHSPGTASSLEGFVNRFQDSLASRAYLKRGNGSFYLQTENYIALNNMHSRPDPAYCNYSWRDPLGVMLYRVNSLAMLTFQSKFLYPGSYEDANGITWLDMKNSKTNTSIPVLLDHNSSSLITYQETYYSSDHRFTWSAFLVSMLVIMCVLPIYWGFWELGRKVSLSPFEIANAFQAPTFAHVKGHAAEEVLKHVGGQRVVYEYVEAKDGTRYAFKTLRDD